MEQVLNMNIKKEKQIKKAQEMVRESYNARLSGERDYTIEESMKLINDFIENKSN